MCIILLLVELVSYFVSYYTVTVTETEIICIGCRHQWRSYSSECLFAGILADWPS